MVRIRFRHLLPILAALTLWLPAQAQLHRGARTIVRGGMLVQRDSLASKTDSLADLSLVRELDSLMTGLFAADSAAVAELRTDDISKADSLYRLKMAGIKIESDTTKHKRGWLMSDSMSLSKVCWISTVLPGYGQIYNKQYWKLPVLYGTLGAGLALYLHENKTYKPLKREYEAYTNKNLSRTPELDALQSRMIRSNTRRQVYLGLTVASYIYFIGDAAVNYSTNEVSDVKKATTLACIFPGAGQIYNKSYWKVPFVVGGFAAMIYCIDWNNRGYQRFKKAYRLLSDYEKNPDAYPDGPTDEFHGRYSADFIRNLRNNYRRNRDLCIIISAGLYVRLRRPVDESRTAGRLYLRSLRRRQPCGIRVQPEFQILTDENPPDHSAADGRRCARIGPRPQTPQEREEKSPDRSRRRTRTGPRSSGRKARTHRAQNRTCRAGPRTAPG